MKIEHIYEIVKTTTLRGKFINITTSFFIKTSQNIPVIIVGNLQRSGKEIKM